MPISLFITMISPDVAATFLKVALLLQLLLLLPVALVADVQIALVFVLQRVVAVSVISFVYGGHTLDRIWIGSIHQILLRWST